MPIRIVRSVILILTSFFAANAFEIEFYPPIAEGLLIREKQSKNLSLTLEGLDGDYQVTFHVLNVDNLRFTDLNDYQYRVFHVKRSENVTVSFTGVFLSKNKVKIYINTAEGKTEYEYDVNVHRSETDEALTNAFVIFASVVTLLNNAFMGIQLNKDVIFSILKKPVGPLIGMACQWGLMAPLAAFWGWLLLPTPVQQFGLFAVGSSPGGGQSNKFTLLVDGNLDLSITLTFFSNILALGMVPLWIYSLGRVFTNQMGIAGTGIQIPYSQIIISLCTTIIPAFVGITIRHFRPHWAKKTLTAVKWSSFLVIVIIVPFAVVVSLYIFRLFTWRNVLAGMCLPYSGFAISYFIAFLLRQEYRNSVTISIETAIQNVQVAMFILRFGLPKPDNDLVLIIPVCCIIFTPIPIWILLIGRLVRNCIQRRRGEPEIEPAPAKSPTGALAEDESPGPLQVLLGALKRLGQKKAATKESGHSNPGLDASSEL